MIESTVLHNSVGNQAPGNIISIEKNMNKGIHVVTGENLLVLQSLQPEGKTVISALDFANGYRLEIGAQFTSIPSK